MNTSWQVRVICSLSAQLGQAMVVLESREAEKAMMTHKVACCKKRRQCACPNGPVGNVHELRNNTAPNTPNEMFNHCPALVKYVVCPSVTTPALFHVEATLAAP